MKKSDLRIIFFNLCIFIIYLTAGKLGLRLAFENASATAIWAPTGIALAVILIFGKKIIPAIFFGAFFVNLTTAGTVVTSLGIALGNTLEGVVGAYLVRRFANGIHAFESVSDIFKYTFLASMLATTISANIGVLTLISGGLATWNNFLSVWTTWWLGDMGGSLLVAPLILVWWTHRKIPIKYKQSLHFIVSIIAIFAVTRLVFDGVVPYPYLYIPIGVWIAFWFNRRGATVSTIIVALITIYYTLSGVGPFITDSLNRSLVQLQLFLNVYSLTSLIFAAIVLEIRKSEKTLVSHEQRFQALIENSYDAIFLVDATSRIIYASPSVKRMLGFMPKELQGMIGFNLVANEDRNMTIRVLAEIVLKPGNAKTVEARLIRKDKTIIWVEATGTNLLLEPDVNAVVVNFHDITEKKLSRDKMLTEKMEDEAMLSSIGEGILATDYKGEITMINQAGCDILGWKEKELVGKPLVDAIPMQDENGKTLFPADRPITKVLSLKKSIVISPTNYYVKKDKTTVPIRLTLTPIILGDDIVGTIEVFYDITKEKEIDKAKSEFVSVASHQLRTPLATINWYVEELVRTGKNLDIKQTTYLGEVYSASKRMVSLIDSLLNASRLELGTLKIEPIKIDLLPLMNQILHDFHPQFSAKNITIQTDYQKDLPQIFIDPKLLTIIIQNLLSNAIKYSRKNGKITLKISSNKKDFMMEISDDGYGIPKNQQAKIFTKMFRADNARTIEPEGTGLGLYIVKEIVDATGGTIRFKSPARSAMQSVAGGEENKGTVFFVTFPVSGMKQKKEKN